MTDASQRYYCPTAGEVEDPLHGGFDVCCDRPDLHRPVPTQQQIANVWSELQRLNVPMRGWWWEPTGTDDMPEPAFGMEVAKEALTDWDADWMTFNWDPVNGWTMDSHCAPGPISKPVVMVVDDAFDAPTVARYFKAVIDGDITEFQQAA